MAHRDGTGRGGARRRRRRRQSRARPAWWSPPPPPDVAPEPDGRAVSVPGRVEDGRSVRRGPVLGPHRRPRRRAARRLAAPRPRRPPAAGAGLGGCALGPVAEDRPVRGARPRPGGPAPARRRPGDGGLDRHRPGARDGAGCPRCHGRGTWRGRRCPPTAVRRRHVRRDPVDLDAGPLRRPVVAGCVARRAASGAASPGGRLLLTLDNPAEPADPGPQHAASRTSPAGPVWCPSPWDDTLDEAGGRAALADAGFEVLATTHLLHAPHVVGTRLARFGWWERAGAAALRRPGAHRAGPGAPATSWPSWPAERRRPGAGRSPPQTSLARSTAPRRNTASATAKKARQATNVSACPSGSSMAPS